MSIFQLGAIIRNRREELGYSQEELADGICSVPTLSRIENGERMPTKNHYEMLMQRLGYSALSLDFFTDKTDFLVHELKFKIRHAYIEKDFGRCRELLAELTAVPNEKTSVDEQFICLYDTLLNQKSIPVSEKLERLEKALRLTCRKYCEGFVPSVLSYEEIILLNNIGICYDALGQQERTVELLYTIVHYYERQVSSSEEALRTQPMILYNLSAVLGRVGRYDECIQICDQGISLMRRTHRCSDYGRIMYNRAWAHIYRNQPGDMDIARESLRKAYCFAYAMGNQGDVDIFSKFYRDTFAEDIVF